MTENINENKYRFYHCYPRICTIVCKRVFDIQEYQSLETNTNLIETNPNYIAIPNYIPIVFDKYILTNKYYEILIKS